MKEYRQAHVEDTDMILEIVQASIKAVYPKFYPQEVVDFFLDFHCKENLLKDVDDGLVGMLMVDGTCVGTGCYRDTHITRVYVLPECQGQGYGSYIMDRLEEIIAKDHDKALLDASLPASHLYEKRGYVTTEHCKYPVENGVTLVYEVMEKKLGKNTTSIDYDGVKKNTTSIDYEGRKFVPRVNTENGEVDGSTLFTYHQSGTDFSADYSGGDVKKGFMVGKVAENGELDFYYEHLNVNDEIRAGKCHSVPKLNGDGKIELHEEWQWLNGDCSTGSSIVVEV